MEISKVKIGGIETHIYLLVKAIIIQVVYEILCIIVMVLNFYVFVYKIIEKVFVQEKILDIVKILEEDFP